MRLKLVLLLAAAALWLPTLHLWFAPADARSLAPALAKKQAQLAKLADSPERKVLRRTNPEWDLMARTFTALSFANLALAEPTSRAAHLAVVDAVVRRTLADEQLRDDEFLLPYVHRAEFRDSAGRSLFVDGEVALMLAARQLVEPLPEYAPLLAHRVDLVAAQLERAPTLAAESYPNEGWTFCNTIALAALRLSDEVDGRDHSELRRRWVESARARLIEPSTGMLVSSFTFDGAPLDGPEGSTLWLAAHMLQVVDPVFAKDQYERARRALARDALGFAWAAEWPAAAQGTMDVDSGPTIPFVDANAGSSGLALVGAAAFGDEELLRGLVTSLRFAAFPVEDETGLTFAAGNQLADAVLLYALVEGPLWRRVGAPDHEVATSVAVHRGAAGGSGKRGAR